MAKNLSQIASEVARKAQEYNNIAAPWPEWLTKEVNGIYEIAGWIDGSVETGLAHLTEGLQAEREALEAARYIPYHPGETHGNQPNPR